MWNNNVHAWLSFCNLSQQQLVFDISTATWKYIEDAMVVTNAIRSCHCKRVRTRCVMQRASLACAYEAPCGCIIRKQSWFNFSSDFPTFDDFQPPAMTRFVCYLSRLSNDFTWATLYLSNTSSYSLQTSTLFNSAVTSMLKVDHNVKSSFSTFNRTLF